MWFLMLKVCGLNSLSSVGGCLLCASDSRTCWWQCPYCCCLSTLFECAFVVYSGVGELKFETIKGCWKMKDMTCFLSVLSLFWNITELLI